MPELVDVVPFMSQVVDGIAQYIQTRTDEPPFQRDNAFIKRHLSRLDRFTSFFEPEVTGIRRLPRKGPYLCVGNHSGGIYTPCMWIFLAEWYRHLGLDTSAQFLAYDMVFALPGIGRFYRRMGGMPANEDNALAAFARSAPLAVYPGGDYEAFRPWEDRARVDFAGRKGFIRLALKRRVPVYPITASGSHETTYVLTRGDWLAESMGLHRMKVKIFPFTLGFPFGVAPGFLPQLPLPSKIRVDIGEPFDWLERYGPEDADDPAVLERCYEEIVGNMQSTLDRLTALSTH